MNHRRDAHRWGWLFWLLLAVPLLLFIKAPEPVTIFESPVSPSMRAYVPLVYRDYRAPSKRGVAIAYEYRVDVECSGLNGLWSYNYSPDAACGGVSMIWNASHIGKPANSSTLLVFNEPDLPSQANMTVEQAVSAWKLVEQAYPNHRLIGPCVSQLGLVWLNQFLTRATQENLRINGLCGHCYGQPAICQPVVELLAQRADERGVKLWLTEFGMADTSKIQAFTDWMDADPRIERYAWFVWALKGSEWWAGGYPLVDFWTGQRTAWGNAYLPQ